jgi:flavin-dependent dehydrogenase
MHSAVARASGLTKRVASKRFALGGHHPDLPTQGWVEIYSSPQGYLALNPLDERACNAVFVLAQDRLARAKDDLHGELARFSQALTGGAHVVDDLRYDEGRRGIGPLAHRTVRPTGHRVLLAGDAAAFIDPFTGQGMYLALTGGRLAAAALMEALASPARERAAWARYERSLGSALRDRELVALMMRAFVGWNVATKRATRSLHRRPGDFAFLIDAVCGKVRANPLALAAAVGAALR